MPDDPRVLRTRHHVLSTTREMLGERSGEPLTLTSLAVRAKVSRRTLYTHWGTIEEIVRDAVRMQNAEAPVDIDIDDKGVSTREKLRAYLRGVRDRLRDPCSRQGSLH